MTFDEFSHLVSYIQKYHSPFSLRKQGRCVKYIDSHQDMRDGKVFSVTLRGFGCNDITLHTVNECASLPTSLFERCMDALTHMKGEE